MSDRWIGFGLGYAAAGVTVALVLLWTDWRKYL